MLLLHSMQHQTVFLLVVLALCSVLEFKLNGGEGVRQGKFGANSDGFLRR